jgi:hypothetical protein
LQWGTKSKIAKVTNILRLTDTDFTKKYEGKMNSSLFQSIYTSLLINEIILKEVNKKEAKEKKIKMWNKVDRRGEGRIE